jgi:transcription elongation factor GreA
MTEQPDTILTRAGYERLARELAEYRERRARQQEELADVHGGAHENYPEEAAEIEADSMRDWMDARIDSLERILRAARVLDEDPDPETVDLGDRVTLDNLTDGEQEHYDVIAPEELRYGRTGVSSDSPVGLALMGRRRGDVIDVDTPGGHVRYVIHGIERTPGADRPRVKRA